jgi:primosomal protein N' (replication factor Y)
MLKRISARLPVPDAQNNIPRQLWLVPHAGQIHSTLVADVAIRVRSPHLYTYAVPQPLAQQLRPGAFLRVPYGRRGRLVAGVCVSTGQRHWTHTLNPIAEIIAGEALSPTLVELGLWISEYYACPPGLTLTSLVPAAARAPNLKRIMYLRASATAAATDLTAKQRLVMQTLGAAERRRREFLRSPGISRASVRRLIERGLIEQIEKSEPRSIAALPAALADRASTPAAPCPEDEYQLTSEQQAALHEISAASTADQPFRVFLLFGIPGSGKTEVYVRAIRQVIAAGRQAILLVPEIALTTQLVERIGRRFEHVAVLHSRLPERERRSAYAAIRAGAVNVVIGTRSAVFAPCPRLGLIVVDEEQDSSFKSLAAPLLHARDVAIKRGQLESIPVVLGSATPALETWHNAQTLPHFRLLRLSQRVGAAELPQTRIVQTGPRELGQTTTLLSPELLACLADTLAAREQALLLHNRRGYAVHLRCTRCGLSVRCASCGGMLVYHQPDNQARCHRCSKSEPAPQTCLDQTCGGRIERVRLAIQRLEEELRRNFPTARLLRLDRDTMRRREDYAAALQRFGAGEADVMLGTQMVAKGLDFPRVRLVGVIDADAILWMPDFRAAEQVFQLVMQVVGRAGRREGPSLALVQCADKATPPIRYAVQMDYAAFARHELALRRQLFYPPFSRMVRLVLADSRPGRARDEADALANSLRELAARINAHLDVGPGQPCVVARLRQMARYQVLARGPRDGAIQRLLRAAADEKRLSPRVQRFTIDVDPLDQL